MKQIQCREIRPWLGEYLDQELEPISAAIVEAHLAECAACRAELSALGRADDAVRAWAQATAFSLDPAQALRLSRALASASPARTTEHPAEETLGQTAWRWTRAVGRTTVKVAGSTAAGTIRAGGELFRGTRRAATTIAAGWRDVADFTGRVSAASRVLRRAVPGRARRFGRGAVAMG